MAGYIGRLLRVDLSTRSFASEPIDADTMRMYAGGGLLGTRLLADATPAGLDPFAPDAPLLFVSSAVAGHAAPALPLFSVVAKSPLTAGIGESRAEGPFGLALKRSGFDAIAITGAADVPVSLAITDGEARVLDATALWGVDTKGVVDRVRAELGECNVAAIGVAGENRVRFASVVCDRWFAVRRMGLGAVMGSKKLKAIAISGGDTPAVADRRALDALARRYAALVDLNPVTRWQKQPPGFGAWVGRAEPGAYAVENYRTAKMPQVRDAYAPVRFKQHVAWSDNGCPGCPSDCIKGFAPGSALHQEAIAALGPNLGIADLDAALALNERAILLGMDPVSLGFTLSFAMECRAADTMSITDLDGVDLRFGSAAAAIAMTEAIGTRTGLGNLLAEGSRRAAAELGGAQPFAMEVKGIELTPFDPRAQTGLALGFATAPFGPRYDIAEHDLDYDDAAPSWPHALELSRALGIYSLLGATDQSTEKARRYAVLSHFWSALDTLLICPFASAPVRILSIDDVAALTRAVTGWESDAAEVMAWGARRMHLMRAYNAREGIDGYADGLPARFFDEPIDAGRLTGARLDRHTFAAMTSHYYALMGWNERGVPTAETLRSHGLAEV